MKEAAPPGATSGSATPGAATPGSATPASTHPAPKTPLQTTNIGSCSLQRSPSRLEVWLGVKRDLDAHCAPQSTMCFAIDNNGVQAGSFERGTRAHEVLNCCRRHRHRFDGKPPFPDRAKTTCYAIVPLSQHNKIKRPKVKLQGWAARVRKRQPIVPIGNCAVRVRWCGTGTCGTCGNR